VLRTGVEQCDDGNNSSGDCCSGACAYETGGDACTSDGNLCTQDLCDDSGSCEHIARPLEPATCLAAPKAKLQILTSGPAEDHKLSWQWTAGDAFDQSVLGLVGVSSEYALCVYDGSSGEYVERGSPHLAVGYNWTSKDPKGALYKDNQSAFGGVSKLQLRTGADGKAKVKLRADGANLVIGSAVYTAAPDVIVQLVNSDGTCWTSSFAGDQIQTNEIGEFQAAVK
jgi:cysteine-rich repeat protein